MEPSAGRPLTPMDELVGPDSVFFGLDPEDPNALYDAAVAGLLRHLARTDPDNAFHVRLAAERTEDLIVSDGIEPIPDRFFLPDPNIPQANLEGLQEIYERYETNLENEFAANLLRGGKVGVEDYPLYQRFVRLITNEINLAKISPRDTVLLIGSGPFPLSAILFHKIAGVKVDCHDISPEACETSRKVIEKLGLTKQINVIDVSGAEWAQPEGKYDYDVIVVALLAQPKSTVLGNISNFGGRTSRVVFRESEGNRRAFYRGMDDPGLLAAVGADIVAVNHAGKDDTISTFLLDLNRYPLVS